MNPTIDIVLDVNSIRDLFGIEIEDIEYVTITPPRINKVTDVICNSNNTCTTNLNIIISNPNNNTEFIYDRGSRITINGNQGTIFPTTSNLVAELGGGKRRNRRTSTKKVRRTKRRQTKKRRGSK